MGAQATYIYIDFSEKGVSETASIIDYKIREFGGASKVLSIEDKALIIQEKIERKKRKEKYLNSHEAFDEGRKQYSKIPSYLDSSWKKLKDILKRKRLKNIRY